jgi:hypothetical protein
MMTRHNVLRAVWQAGAYADGSGNGETGKVAIFFALASPEAVLVVVAGKLSALLDDWTLVAELAGAGFTTGAGLGAFGFWWEKERCATFTRRKIGPMFRIFHCYWSGNVNHCHFFE